jgi:hypothetical protein
MNENILPRVFSMEGYDYAKLIGTHLLNWSFEQSIFHVAPFPAPYYPLHNLLCSPLYTRQLDFLPTMH